MSSAEKLLDRMRRSRNGWSQSDFEILYTGFGFKKKEGGNHTIYIHERFTQLRATVARHSSLAKGYADHAVSVLDQLIQLEAEDNHDD